MSTGEAGGPQEDSGVKKWERPWSVRELKEGSREWTLAADAGVRTVHVQYPFHLQKKLITYMYMYMY